MDVTCSLHARMRGARILVLLPPGFAVKNTLRGIGGNGSDQSVTPEDLWERITAQFYTAIYLHCRKAWGI